MKQIGIREQYCEKNFFSNIISNTYYQPFNPVTKLELNLLSPTHFEVNSQLAFRTHVLQIILCKTRKCLLRGHILAPSEGLRALELPGVNPKGRPQESGGDFKAISAKKIFCDGRTNGRTDKQT